jgi:hypothetical protein
VPVIAILLTLFVVLIVGGLVVGYQVVRSQYYVGNNGGNVAIFRGMNDKVLGFSLFSVYQPTSIPVSGLGASAAQEVARSETGTKAMAQQFVANIRKQYSTCQAAFTRLHEWTVTKPKPVRKKELVHGKLTTKLIPGKRGPKPVIPSFCPPPPAGT